VAEADHDDTSSQYEWVSPREYIQHIAGDPAAETEAEYSVEEQFRRGILPCRYRAGDGALHHNDLPDDFRREADVDLTGATATRPARIIREDNPDLPLVRGNLRPNPQWFGDSDPFLRPEYIDRELPAETITELRFPIPRAPAIEPAANPLSVKDWLFDEVARRKEAGDIPTIATLFAEQLAKQMSVDVQAGKCRRLISADSIRVRLYDSELWPPK
jgi:hypothetical protein